MVYCDMYGQENKQTNIILNMEKEKIAIIVPFERDEESDGFKWKETRYMLVDKESGEVLNDAQGYGFASESKAYRGFLHNKRGYKIETTDKCKKENAEHYKAIALSNKLLKEKGWI